jgi:hypothetical protein
MKEKLDKGLFAALMTIFAIVGSLVLLGVFKGEAILFAITNESQVMDEKASWDAYVKAYPNE